MRVTVKDLKEMGAVILLPDAETYLKLQPPQDPIIIGYNRTYFNGIRVLFGNFDWVAYQKMLASEKALIDDTEVK